MRIRELTEAISVTHLSKPLKDAIYEQLLYCANQIGYKDKKVPSAIKQYSIENTSLSKVIESLDLADTLLYNLRTLVAYAIQEVIRGSTDVKNVTVLFKETDVNGYVSGTDIVLSNSRIKTCAEEILQTGYNITLDNLENDKNIFDDYFKTFREMSLRDLVKYSDVDKVVTAIVSTTIHELVHVIQHDTQYKKGRTDTEYRSYLEKDKSKFHNTVSKFYNKGQMSNTEYNSYFSSPQEIAAFAHQNALKCIDDMGVYNATSIEELDEIKQNAPINIHGYIDSKIANSKVGLQVFKRINKLMYQEVMRAIQYVEAKLNNAKGG